MAGTKSAFASGTVWAGIAQLVLSLFGFLGIDIAPGDATLALDNLEAAVVAITGIVTIVRRVTARSRIG